MIDRQSIRDTIKERKTVLSVEIGMFHLTRLGKMNGNHFEGMGA